MKPEDNRLIEEYLDGRLSVEARATLEARLAGDEELAQALKLRQDMDRQLRKREKRAKLQNTLADLNEEFFKVEVPTAAPKEAKRIPLHRRWYAYAAAIALVVTVSLVLYLNLRPGLYDQYAQHAPLALTAMSAQTDALAAEAELAFNSKNYEAAYTALQGYMGTNQTNNLANLYLGISALETDRLSEAQTIFNRLKAETDGTTNDYAQWYLALTYLKQGDKVACRAALEEIGENSEWYEEAQGVLGRL